MSIICTHAPWGLLDVDHRPKTTFLHVRIPWAHPPTIYQFMICAFYTVHANHLNYMDICRIAKRWFTSRSAQARSHKISIVFCNVIFSRRWEIFLVPLTSYRYINCTGRGREWNGEEGFATIDQRLNKTSRQMALWQRLTCHQACFSIFHFQFQIVSKKEISRDNYMLYVSILSYTQVWAYIYKSYARRRCTLCLHFCTQSLSRLYQYHVTFLLPRHDQQQQVLVKSSRPS